LVKDVVISTYVQTVKIQYSHAWHHVINRGRRGDGVFSGRQEGVRFLVEETESGGILK
jgi:hypothetical protein